MQQLLRLLPVQMAYGVAQLLSRPPGWQVELPGALPNCVHTSRPFAQLRQAPQYEQPGPLGKSQRFQDAGIDAGIAQS